MGDTGTTDVVGGRYRLLHVIGTGGMGRVWLAEDEVLHRQVAVKEIATDPALRTAVREARAAARLDHPGVAAVYDVLQRDGRSWIVMEYVRSRSLHETIRDDGPLPHPRAAHIGLGILAALRAAHTAGVLHLDVKPHNVLLADDGRIVLTDFGLAHIHGHDHSTEPLIGSPHFVAPERLRGEQAGEKADLFSLGATLYATVEGRPPFHRSTAEASLSALLSEPPNPPTHRGELTGIIKALLAKDPAARPTADKVEAALHRAATIDPPDAEPHQPTAPPPAAPAPHRPTAPHPAAPAPHRPTAPHPAAPAPHRGAAAHAAGPAPRPPAAARAGGPTPHQDAAGDAAKTAPHRAAAAGQAVGIARVADVAAPDGSPDRAHRPPLARGTKISVAVAALLLAGTTGTALALDLRASPPTPASSSITGPPPTCAPGGMPVGGRAQFRGYAVPAGWLWHEDPLGFAVALPEGWTRTAEGGTVCFRDPGGTRTLSVDATARPTPDPRSVWTAAETRMNLPDYRRTTLGIRWDFTWQPPDDPVRRHERRQLVERPDGRAYLVGWATSEPDRAAGEATLTLALTSLS